MTLTLDDILAQLWRDLDNEESVKIITEIFSESHSNAEKVSLAYQNLILLDLLPCYKATDGMKCAELSADLRSAGNRMFARKIPDLSEALELYTQSIAIAPHPMGEDSQISDHLSIAFANRSAVFFAMKKYDMCLKDIEQAMKYKYPNHLLPKLYERMGKCYLMMGERPKAVACIQDAIGSLTTENSVAEETLKRLERLKIKAEMPSESAEETRSKVHDIPKVAYKHHEQIPAFSNCIDVQQDPLMGGRFIQATKDIKPGDVLVVEKSYSSFLLPENYYSHCYGCLRRCDGLIPCRCCSKVMFCSESCLDESESFHRVECPILSALLNLNMGHDWLLALRVLLVATSKSGTLKKLQKNIKDLELNHNDKDLTGFETNKKLQSTDERYSVIHYQIQNLGFRSFKSVYKLATIAACILDSLAADTDFFNAHSDAKKFVGGLLLQYLLSLSCNSYSVADLLRSTTEEKSLTTETIGCAVYAYSSFFNHSCDANVFRSYHSGDVMAIVASRPISRGEQVFCDYGFSHSDMELRERRSKLRSQYFFYCNCVACAEDWPTSSILELVNPTFLCPWCATALVREDPSTNIEVCQTCQKTSKMLALQARFQDLTTAICDIKFRMLDGCLMDFSTELAESLVCLHELVERPAQIIVVAQDAFHHNKMLTGNFYRV